MSDDFDSKRPDHPDFMTHGELKKSEFSGVRHNSISNEVEIWAAGEIRETIPRTALILDAQLAIAQAIERVFGIHYVIVGEHKNAIKLH